MTELTRPIPDQSHNRKIKEGYRLHPIDREHPLFSEGIVPVTDYGLAGLSYYSQPNNTTGDPVEGVSEAIFLRKTVAEKLGYANSFLRSSDEAARLLDGRVELYLRDGLRPLSLQAYVHDVVIPNRLRAQYPDWDEERVLARRNQTIAYPNSTPESMSPHATGGVIDLNLRYTESQQLVEIAKGTADLGSDAIYPDFLENIPESDIGTLGLQRAVFERARAARRILHNVMDNPGIGEISMTVNPTETWHYGYGDQLSARVLGRAAAFYGLPDEEQLPAGVTIADYQSY
jgi:D-alanyl-D-alanine dipeptidase